MQLPNPRHQPSSTTTNNTTTALLAPILEANAYQYATTRFTPEQGELSMPPAKKLAIIACMDARLEPTTILGLKTGDAHVIRNAGGRVSDALRSLIISQQLLGTREVVIMHHTDCGMMTFTDSSIRNTIKKNLDENADHIAFQAFVDLRQSVRDDIRSLVENPLVLDVPISGYIYDVFSGRVEKVQQVGGSVGGGGREDVERMLWTKAKKFGCDC